MLGNGEGGVNCVKPTLSGPERVVAGYSSGVVVVWSTKTLEVIQTFALHDGEVTDVCPSSKNPRLVASCGIDSKVFLCDLETRKSVTTIKLRGDVPTCLSYSEDAVHVAIGTQKGSILYYSWMNPAEPLYEILGAHSPYPVTAMSFQSPMRSSAPSTPSRTRKSVSGLGKSPAQSPARRNKAEQNFLLTSNEKGSLGSTLSSLSASTAAQPGLTVGAAAAARHNSNPGRMLVPTPIEAVQESHGEVPNMEEVVSLPLSESTTPPNSPASVHAAVVSANRAASIAAARQRDLEASRAFLAHVEGERKSQIAQKVAQDTSSTTSANLSLARNAIEAPGRLQQEASVSYFPNTTSINSSEDAPHTQSLRQSNGRLRESSGAWDRASAATSEKGAVSQGEDRSDAPHYTRADVDSLISARMNHKLNEAEVAAKEPSERQSVRQTEEDGLVSELRRGVSTVTSQELQESLAVLKFDIHCDIRDVLTEQARQFSMYRDDVAEMVGELQKQLQSVLDANSELRKENERLRHIY